MKKEVLKIINALRESDENIQHIFMMGSCYRFHLFLKTIFPQAEAYLHLDKDHIVSKINGNLFDIKGEIPKKHIFLYEKLEDEDLEMVKKWSFSNQMVISIGECPHCEEPILI